jgi:hypothetical protein
MTSSSTMRWRLVLTLAAACSGLLPWPAVAQQPPPKEEEPWAAGRPKSGPGNQMAPVPPFLIPTPADQLPIGKIKLPPGFKAEVWGRRFSTPAVCGRATKGRPS